ncbi:hypothetical protein CCY01nite_49700 [Chitinophaga cymbidii]|uniref:Uncharacterized protein n=2 Tax=Chitinophaga cymbidii TaxID=1096750 RepID=A0A512RSN3_9BACT|nr:hypothetical protein CCY01nite_49700 [Chitinophaga cymbidii]
MLLNSGLIYEINITRTYLDQPPQKKERKFDSFVEPTLKEILNNFIRSNGTLPVYFYVCENSDEKEAARRKLFANRWYAQSSLNDWHLYNYELRESDTDRDPWFLGLLIHENHPYTTQFPLAFEAFVKNEISLSKILSTVLL